MQIKTYNNQTITIDLEYSGGNLVALPALVDPHVHFRIPGDQEKEDWHTAEQAAIAGGYTTVFDMPNNIPSTTNRETLEHKKSVIQDLFDDSQVHINYKLWLGATTENLKDIEDLKNEILGIKLFMGSSTGSLLVDKKANQAKIFELAGKLGLVVGVHAEDEKEMQKQKKKIGKTTDVTDHSKIRTPEVAKRAVTQAIELATKYNTKLYILHVSTKDELILIDEAKRKGVQVYAEVTPHHLFLNENDYASLGTKGQMNPPLRTLEHQDALWNGILDDIVDTIGTDHAPHTLEQKSQSYGHAPSGVPGIETCLPLLLDAHNKGGINLEKIVKLTRTNIENIFNIPSNNDWTIVDLDLIREVKNENLKTKCGWSPFDGKKLKGWPVATILNGTIYKC